VVGVRKAVLVAAAVLLVVQGVVLGLVGLILGLAVEQQNMSFGGVHPHLMAVGSWIGQGALALLFVIVGVLVARAARRDAAAGMPTRVLLLVCAVTTGVLAAVVLALMGVGGFIGLILMLAVYVMAFLLIREDAVPPGVPAEPPVDEPGGEPGAEPGREPGGESRTAVVPGFQERPAASGAADAPGSGPSEPDSEAGGAAPASAVTSPTSSVTSAP
jgi:hypothetical protein